MYNNFIKQKEVLKILTQNRTMHQSCADTAKMCFKNNKVVGTPYGTKSAVFDEILSDRPCEIILTLLLKFHFCTDIVR